MRPKSFLWFCPLLISFCFALACPLSGLAQTDEKEKAAGEEQKRQELERKSLAMVDELASQALSLKLPENRALVLTSAADLLWTHDEKRARNLFWDALNNLAPPITLADESTAKEATNKVTAKDSAPKPATNDTAQTLNQYYVTFQARREFLRKVAQHDPQLALDMLRATRQAAPPQIGNEKYQLPQDLDLEQEIAQEAAASDPKRALQIARESLQKGLSYQLLGFLIRLNQRSPEVALEFAGDLIDKLQAANLAQDQIAWWMAVTVLRMSRPPADVPTLGATLAGPSQLKLNDDQRRELAELLAEAGLSASSDPNLVFGLTEIMPEIEQLAPDRAAKIKTKMSDSSRQLPREQAEFGALSASISKSTPEELLRAAAGASGPVRDALLQTAVSKAVAEGKANELRESIKTAVEDQSQRNKLNDLLDEQQMAWALNHGDTEAVQKLLPSIRLKEKRAEALAQLALLIEKKGDHDAALKLLDEAQALVKINFQSQTQSDALLVVLLACSLIDPPRAFAAIEPVVDRANDDIARLLLLDKFVKSGMVKNGEVILQQPRLISLDFAVFRYGPGITALAKADFNRTKSLTDRIQRNELRIMARLIMVQTLLGRREQTMLVAER
jgi:hypothetical protein